MTPTRTHLPLPAGRSGSSPGSQGLYGPEVVDQVNRIPSRSPDVSTAAKDIGAQVVWKPVLTSADGIRRIMLEANGDDACIGLIAWMHTFSPAKMWIAGLDALQKPLLHLHTQAGESLPWSEIDMDFMNLNQAAHGDREFGYIQSRLGVARKTVAGHVSHPQTLAAIGAWVGPRGRRHDSLAAARPVRRQHARRRGHRGRQGRSPKAFRCLGQHLRGQRPGDVVDQVTDAEIDAVVAEYDELFAVVPALRPGGDQRDSLRHAAQIEIGMRQFLQDGRLRCLHHELRGPRWAAATPGPCGAATDGRRLRIRRRGRLEDLAAAGHCQVDGPTVARRHVLHGGLHLPPRAR